MNTFSPLAISHFGSISPLGMHYYDVLKNYLSSGHFFSKYKDNWCAEIAMSDQEIISSLQKNTYDYTILDRSVILAMKAAENAFNQYDGNKNSIGINISSSRGATHLWEKNISEFLSNNTVQTLASPTTSLGNISSWVAHHLDISSYNFSHSMTCSGALFSLLNAAAWLHSNMIEKMLVGASEASITDFTLAQLKSLRIYSQQDSNFPSQAGNVEKKNNTLILGEGAAMFLMEKPNGKSKFLLKGIGFAMEKIKHSVWVSPEAETCKKAMLQAIESSGNQKIDVIITHTPGTLQGDKAEMKAIKNIFEEDSIPLLTNNKWKIGHTFAASGAMSLEMALLMLENQLFFSLFDEENIPMKINNVLINSLGFGGNAVSVVVGL